MNEQADRRSTGRSLSLDRRVTKLEAIVEVLCAEIVAQTGRIAALSHDLPRAGNIELRGEQIRELSLDLRVTKLETIVETLRGEVIKQSKQIAKLSPRHSELER